MATRRPLCADLSREHSEPLSATASRIDYWLLIEYRGLWNRAPLRGSGLSDEIKDHLRTQLNRRAPARLLFVKRPDRRGRDELRVFHGSTRVGEANFFGRDLAAYDELLELDLAAGGQPLDHPLFVVCTHGKRDRCCAVYGRPLYDALRSELDEDWVWQATHVGGDRFAGNVVVFPDGLYFGRVGPPDAGSLVDAYLDGRIDLDHYRGRCVYTFPVQAAEHALRAELRLAGIDDLTLAHAEREDDHWRVAFRASDGAVHERTVVAELGELTYLTCDAKQLQRPRRFRAATQP
jgi:hypothetical protein